MHALTLLKHKVRSTGLESGQDTIVRAASHTSDSFQDRHGDKSDSVPWDLGKLQQESDCTYLDYHST